MKKFAAFVLQVVVLVGLVVVAVMALQLPPEIGAYTVLAGAGLIAVVALIGIVRTIPFASIRIPQRKPRDSSDVEARAKIVTIRRRLRARLRALTGALHPLLVKRDTTMPLWIVLGPEGAGKSSLVSATEGSEIEGGEPAITRANDAAFVRIDAPGEQETGSEEVLIVLLEELRRWFRPQPIHGVVLCLRHDHTPGEVDAVKGYLRKILESLEAQVPVVAVITHIDRLGGFTQFVRDLEAHSDPLGALLPLCESPSRVREAARQALDSPGGPLSWVDERGHSLMLLGEDRDLDPLKAYDFTREFERVVSRSTESLQALAGESILGGETLRLRGVFFTGLRVDRDSTPVFAEAVMQEIVPGSSQYATRSRRGKRRRRQRQILLVTAIALLASLTLTAALSSSAANRVFLSTTLESAEQLRTSDALAVPEDIQDLRKAVEIWRANEPPRGQGLGLFRAEEVAPAVSREYRRIVCERVIVPLVRQSSESLLRFSREHLNSAPKPGRQSRALEDLRLYLLLSDPAPDEESEHYPIPSAWASAETDWLVEELASRWSRSISVGGAGCDSCKRSIEVLRDIVVSSHDGEMKGGSGCLEVGPQLEVTRVRPLVDGVRRTLSRGETEDIAYSNVVSRANKSRDGTVTLFGVVGSARLQQRAEVVVDRAFTRAGWLDVQRSLAGHLSEQSSVPQWLLPAAAVSERGAAMCSDLRAKYVAKYQEEWRSFFESIYIERPGTLEEAQNLLADLSGEGEAGEPLPALFKTLRENTVDLPPLSCTTSEERRESGDQKVIDRLSSLFGEKRGGTVARSSVWARTKLKSVRDSFESSRVVEQTFSRLNSFASSDSADKATGLDTYQETVRELWQQVSEANIGGDSEELAAEVKVHSRKVRDVIRGADLQHFRSSVEDVLLPPVEGVGDVVAEGAFCEIVREWCESVVEPLALTTELYPFTPSSKDSTTISSVESFFHPTSGKIAEFRTKHLAPYLRRQGDAFTKRPPSGKNSNPLNPRAVDFFNDSEALGSLMFPRGGEAKIEFELTMQCGWASKVGLSVDGTEYEYICDSRDRKNGSWPGEEKGARFWAEGEGVPVADVRRTGDFAFFELLERAAHPKRHGSSISLSFDLNVPRRDRIDITLTPSEGGSVFYGRGDTTEFLAPWRQQSLRAPPRALFQGLEMCCAGGSI